MLIVSISCSFSSAIFIARKALLLSLSFRTSLMSRLLFISRAGLKVLQRWLTILDWVGSWQGRVWVGNFISIDEKFRWWAYVFHGLFKWAFFRICWGIIRVDRCSGCWSRVDRCGICLRGVENVRVFFIVLLWFTSSGCLFFPGIRRPCRSVGLGFGFDRLVLRFLLVLAIFLFPGSNFFCWSCCPRSCRSC